MRTPEDGPREFCSIDEAVGALRNLLDQKEEGTKVFHIQESNLSSEESDGSVIQEIVSNSGDRGIRLWKKDGNLIVYDFFEVNVGLRRCAVDLDDFATYSDFFVSLTWSPEEIALYIGPIADDYEGDLISATSSEIMSQVRRDEKGRLMVIGDSGVQVGYYHVHEDGREILRPRAKEIFDFSETKCRILLQMVKDTDEFLVESTVVQQVIVVMVTGLETYLEERFIEMCTEMDIPKKKIANAVAVGYRQVSGKDLLEQAEKKGVRIQDLARDQLSNFQDINEAHKIYSQASGYNLQNSLNNTGNRGFIERNIDARHRIIHEATDMTILNIDRVPPQEPVFANHEYGLKVVNTFSDTVGELHRDTKSIE